MTRFVAYYRVSTQRQGSSGLGLEAQQIAVQAFVLSVSGQIMGEFQEIESGANPVRPQLNSAIQLAKAKKATLVIAKLDRLARNVYFISQLMESKVEFVAVDLPYANRLTIHILAAVAEHEREMISKRTREALQRAKERGVTLGNPNAASQARFASDCAKKKVNEFAIRIADLLRSIHVQERHSLTRTAKALNSQGIKTQRGNSWTATGVSNLLRRMEGEK